MILREINKCIIGEGQKSGFRKNATRIVPKDPPAPRGARAGGAARGEGVSSRPGRPHLHRLWRVGNRGGDVSPGYLCQSSVASSESAVSSTSSTASKATQRSGKHDRHPCRLLSDTRSHRACTSPEHCPVRRGKSESGSRVRASKAARCGGDHRRYGAHGNRARDGGERSCGRRGGSVTRGSSLSCCASVHDE